MKLPTIFKQTPNKKYHYTPRYYDERKERLEKLKNQHKPHVDEDYTKDFHQKSYRDSWKVTYQKASNKNTNYRLVVILLILFGIVYLLLKGYL